MSYRIKAQKGNFTVEVLVVSTRKVLFTEKIVEAYRRMSKIDGTGSQLVPLSPFKDLHQAHDAIVEFSFKIPLLTHVELQGDTILYYYTTTNEPYDCRKKRARPMLRRKTDGTNVRVSFFGHRRF